MNKNVEKGKTESEESKALGISEEAWKAFKGLEFDDSKKKEQLQTEAGQEVKKRILERLNKRNSDVDAGVPPSQR